MSTLGINNWVVAWTPAGDLDDPTAGKIRIGHKAGNNAWSRPYAFVEGAVWVGWKDQPLAVRVVRMLLLFQAIVVRDGIDPQLAHKEFLKVDEYRRNIACDIPGSTNPAEFY